MEVYGLCLGGNVFGWTADKEASFAVLDAYVEAGGNFIDTADTYMRPNMGQSERIIGEWMASRGNRDELVIATKVGSDGGLSAENIAAHVDGSLERLQTDRIDLYYAHKDDGSVPVEETVRAFDQTVRDGKVLQVAASNVPPDRLRESLRAPVRARASPPYTWLQPHYNLVEREGYERDYAPIVAEHGLSVAPYYALASGFLTGKYRDGDGDSPRAEKASLATSTTAGARVLDALDDGRRGARREAAPRSRSPGCAAKPGVVAPIASATLARAARAGAARRDAATDRRRSGPARRGERLMDSTRQAFLDELYAHGRAHDEGLEDRLERFRNVEPETAELLGVLVRAMGAERVLEIGTSNGYSTIWLGDAAEAVGGSVDQPRDRGRAHRRRARQPHPGRRRRDSSSCARRTPPRPSRRSTTARSTSCSSTPSGASTRATGRTSCACCARAACWSSTTRSRTPRSWSSSPSSSTPTSRSPARS